MLEKQPLIGKVYQDTALKAMMGTWYVQLHSYIPIYCEAKPIKSTEKSQINNKSSLNFSLYP